MDFWRHMSVRTKMLLIVCISILVANVAIYLAAKYIILQSFQSLERREIITNLQQVHDAFLNGLTQMDTKIKDWSNWDESYQFASDPVGRRSFAENQLLDTTLVNMQINVMMYINTRGEIIYKKVVDLQNQAALQDSTTPEELLRVYPELLEESSENAMRIKEGIVALTGGPMLVVAVPILPSDGQGAKAGTLIFGKFIDTVYAQDISKLTHLKITLLSLNDLAAEPEDVRVAIPQMTMDRNFHVSPSSESRIAGYSSLYDLKGKSAFWFRVDRTRDIYNSGKSTLTLLALFTSAALVIFGLIMILLLRKKVIERLEWLTEEVKAVGTGHNLSARIQNDITDEVGTVVVAINNMLNELSVFQQKDYQMNKLQSESAEKLKERLNEIQHLNDLMTGRELKMIELKDTVRDLKSRLGESSLHSEKKEGGASQDQ